MTKTQTIAVPQKFSPIGGKKLLKDPMSARSYCGKIYNNESPSSGCDMSSTAHRGHVCSLRALTLTYNAMGLSGQCTWLSRYATVQSQGLLVLPIC